MKKNILLVEPFFSGSHETWAKQYKANSRHHIEILSLKGKFWKWRMYGGAVTLAEAFIKMDFKPDIILATDMLDLTTFLALTRQHLDPAVKVAVYFHENQLAYPWSPMDKDKKAGRDLSYGFVNYTTALSADKVFYNSNHNKTTFHQELRRVLKSMPDNRHKDAIDLLDSKSEILPIAMDLKRLDQGDPAIYKGELPLILWNHRWEHDKNPEDFFKALFKLKEDGFSFKVALLGGEDKGNLPIIQEAMEKLEGDIVVSGFLKYSDYISWIQAADILPVTSHHDFFGISVMEAVYCGCYPILPKRLTYPDLFEIDRNPDLFYEGQGELIEQLKYALTHIDEIRKTNHRHMASKYDWSAMVSIYDDAMLSF